MDFAAVLTELVKQGPIGAIAVCFIYLYVKKDAELRAEAQARVADAIAVRQVLLDVQERALTTATKLADMFDTSMKLVDRREGGSR
jgi:hypothetical protein